MPCVDELVKQTDRPSYRVLLCNIHPLYCGCEGVAIGTHASAYCQRVFSTNLANSSRFVRFFPSGQMQLSTPSFPTRLQKAFCREKVSLGSLS